MTKYYFASCRNRSGGFALITVLVVIVVGLVLALSAVNSSLMDEKMSGNYRASTMASMVAEYGVAERFEHVLSLTGSDAQSFKDKVESVDVSASCSETPSSLKDVVSDWGESLSVSGDVVTGMSSLVYDYYECYQDAWPEAWNEDGRYFAYKVVGRVTSGDVTVAANEQISLYTFFYSPPPNLDPGILAECVKATGNNNYVKGSIHANLEGCLDIVLSKKEDPELSSLTEGLEYTIPKVSDFLVAFKEFYGIDGLELGEDGIGGGDPGELVKHITLPSGIVYLTCKMNSSTPTTIDGELITIFYCPNPDAVMEVGQQGSSNFSGDLSYLTMISEGEILFRGASDTILDNNGDPALGMALISVGDINFNGSRDSYGLFWSDGDVRQNGNSEMNGSIVSSGEVNFRGNIDFDGGVPLAIDDLNVFKRVRLFSWSG
ncbi:PilX N-terminal domain-containing pilus assembly protein [Halomonas alkalicola]|uniref:PilX N-terminal domain-containing pilus assembly protein n=1 Tax=Halomonas alkalicola TaxID=1930622 RepID=UPI0026601D56|nr:PilX N-terminal domain-containing pilus assembly protein [Halomonas alkalicola]